MIFIDRYIRDLSAQSSKESHTLEEFDFNSAVGNRRNASDLHQDKNNRIEAGEQNLYQLKSARKLRMKRETFGRQSLCQTNFQFITPKAALNAQGNLILMSIPIVFWYCNFRFS